jgi:hypothetical protein
MSDAGVKITHQTSDVKVKQDYRNFRRWVFARSFTWLVAPEPTTGRFPRPASLPKRVVLTTTALSRTTNRHSPDSGAYEFTIVGR